VVATNLLEIRLWSAPVHAGGCATTPGGPAGAKMRSNCALPPTVLALTPIIGWEPVLAPNNRLGLSVRRPAVQKSSVRRGQ